MRPSEPLGVHISSQFAPGVDGAIGFNAGPAGFQSCFGLFCFFFLFSFYCFCFLRKGLLCSPGWPLTLLLVSLFLYLGMGMFILCHCVSQVFNFLPNFSQGLLAKSFSLNFREDFGLAVFSSAETRMWQFLEMYFQTVMVYI